MWPRWRGTDWRFKDRSHRLALASSRSEESADLEVEVEANLREKRNNRKAMIAVVVNMAWSSESGAPHSSATGITSQEQGWTSINLEAAREREKAVEKQEVGPD